ncbi:MAG: hypothetical protein EHM14_10500 [Methanothrix sp.]|nr:MAG: hypothetical protein EHM14_10500 [Methanothrix sp.]
MGSIAKIVLVMILAALLLPIVTCSANAVEYRPGEKAAEDLFNKGIGKPWVGGDPFPSSHWTGTQKSVVVRPYSSYSIIGYLNAAKSLSIATDTGNGLQLLTGFGSYPVYGYYSGNKLMGVFIDLSSSSQAVQMYQNH